MGKLWPQKYLTIKFCSQWTNSTYATPAHHVYFCRKLSNLWSVPVTLRWCICIVKVENCESDWVNHSSTWNSQTRCSCLQIFSPMTAWYHEANYHIWQNFQVGKHSWLECKMGIRRKTFAVACLCLNWYCQSTRPCDIDLLAPLIWQSMQCTMQLIPSE